MEKYYQKCYPENTLLSFTKALEAGAHFIETDILFSADHQPVLYHDTLMNRISGIESAIHLANLSELVTCPAYEPERLGQQFSDQTITPLTDLVDLLKQHPETTAFIELKRSGLHIEGIEDAFNIVTNVLEPVIHQCVLISFSDEFIQHAQQQGYKRLGLVLKKWEELESDLIATIQPEFIFCDAEIIPEKFMFDSINSESGNSKVVVYEIADPDEAIHWFNQGADLVETFDFGGMMSALTHRTL